MATTLTNSIKRKITFRILGSASGDKTLCILPGFYDTMRIIATAGTAGAPVCKAVYDEPTNLVNAGYNCDQVADESYQDASFRRSDGVQVYGEGCSFRDVLAAVRYCGMQVSNIRIKNLRENNAGEELFQQQIKIGQAVIGEQSGLRSLNLSSFVKASNYDRSFVDIDLEEANLLCDKETLMFMRIPKDAKFNMELTFED